MRCFPFSSNVPSSLLASLPPPASAYILDGTVLCSNIAAYIHIERHATSLPAIDWCGWWWRYRTAWNMTDSKNRRHEWHVKFGTNTNRKIQLRKNPVNPAKKPVEAPSTPITSLLEWTTTGGTVRQVFLPLHYLLSLHVDAFHGLGSRLDLVCYSHGRLETAVDSSLFFSLIVTRSKVSLRQQKVRA